ncbi:MAG: orotidine-5'-phosphate decarboxylase [Sphingopyxis granuli]
MHWGDTVKSKIETVGSLVLGIDPAPDHAPLSLCHHPDLFLERYVTALLDSAEGKVGFVKFQSAYFEAFGSGGMASLARCIAIARERGMSVILDAKRGDIGSTADAYARAYLVPGGSDLEVDCLTVNPFLGPETLEPFVNCARDYGKGLFVLVKTSNPGSGWLQDQSVDSAPVSERVAETVAEWADETLGDCGIGAVGAVVGATYPSQGQRLRTVMPRSVFLAPGLGFQGGDPRATSALATPTGPVLVSASRGVAAVEDREMPLDAYRALIRSRLDGFRQTLSPAAIPASLPG